MLSENNKRKTRTILVKKKGSTSKPKHGIHRFDEYIEKSGLEPKIYQREGVEFCLRREERRTSAVVVGGIIADEMGLGKTIMMMGLILSNLAAYQRTLIVVPVALITQWVAQIQRTIIDTGVKPDLSVVVYHGSARKHRVVLSKNCEHTVWCHRPPKRGGGSITRSSEIDIVITTYGCVAMEEPVALASAAASVASKPKKTTPPALSLLTFRADRVIFDEAHHLRNKNSRVFKGAMRIVSVVEQCHRPSVWIVTGTPIQNKISDLKSLCYILGFGVSDLMTEERRRAIRDEYVLRRTKVSVGMVAADARAVADAAVCVPRLQSLKHLKLNVSWGSENELELSREIHHKAKNTNDRSERLKLYTRMRQMCVWPALMMNSDNKGKDNKGKNNNQQQTSKIHTDSR